MARIELAGISHSYRRSRGSDPRRDAGDYVLRDLDLVWEDGQAHALLGPSGCGKTTILNLVSGILVPTHGRVLCDGREVTAQPARRRGVAQVFQFPVVYEGMTVAGNLAFPLRNAGLGRDETRRRVHTIAELLDLAPILERPASRISQAEKQRVSLGRGIVRRDTVAILLDEPLTVIDPKEKYGLRRKIKQVQRELHMTMVYVTHDQHEALTFADQVTVMDHGAVVQQGTPEDLYRRPATTFVGFFIGSPGMNLLASRLEEGRLQVAGHALPVSGGLAGRLAAHGRDFTLGIRPEAVALAVQERPDGLPCRVRQVEDLGTHRIVTLACGDEENLRCRGDHQTRLDPRHGVWAVFPEESLSFFRDGRRIL